MGISPLIQTAWVLSNGGKRLISLHMFLASLAAAGGMMELVSLLFVIGLRQTSNWISGTFDMDWSSSGNDGTGWKVLELTKIVTNGMVVWISAFQSLACEYG